MKASAKCHRKQSRILVTIENWLRLLNDAMSWTMMFQAPMSGSRSYKQRSHQSIQPRHMRFLCCKIFFKSAVAFRACPEGYITSTLRLMLQLKPLKLAKRLHLFSGFRGPPDRRVHQRGHSAVNHLAMKVRRDISLENAIKHLKI